MISRIRRRAMAALAVLGLSLGIPLGMAIASHQFADVPNSNQFHNDIDAIADAGVTFGCGGGNYCPTDFVTREQMAAFMNRLGSLDGSSAPSVNADQVDGIDASGFVQGTGDAFIQRGSADLSGVVDPSENRTTLGSIAGLGSFTVGGANVAPGNDCDVTFTNTSGADVMVNGGAGSPLANGASIELAGVDSRPTGVSATFSIATVNAATVASGEVVLMFGFPSASIVCAGSVHALVSG